MGAESIGGMGNGGPFDGGCGFGNAESRPVVQQAPGGKSMKDIIGLGIQR